MWSSRNGNNTSFSRSVKPTMCVVELRLTNRPRRPDSGCMTTTGCSTGGHCLCISARSRLVCPAAIALRIGLVMSCTARRPSTSSRSDADSASYAANTLAKHMSPPTGGSSTARRIEPIGGLGMNVLSLCHSSAPSPFGLTWSSTVTLGRSWYFVASGGRLRGPNRSANARCDSSSRCWSRKKITPWSSSAWRISATLSSLSGSEMSTPWISAPITAVTGLISIVPIASPSLVRSGVPVPPPAAGDNVSPLRILGQGGNRMAEGPRITHLDQFDWQEVRRQQHGDHTASVYEKWVEFSPRYLSLYARWDSGMIVQPHGHNSDHVVFVIEGDMMCGDVHCPPGTHIALDRGDTFGPF